LKYCILQLFVTTRYQTLQANAPSVTIARSRGFTQYAATIAVRLRDVASYPS
jgi:hypothetical protein